jgi:anti-sigma B factor antagonist
MLPLTALPLGAFAAKRERHRLIILQAPQNVSSLIFLYGREGYMTIEKNIDKDKVEIILEGKLDTQTAPQLDLEMAGLKDMRSVDMDFAKLDYVSSAGLRVLLNVQKRMNASGGRFIIRNVNESVMEVFEMTGFADILTIV